MTSSYLTQRLEYTGDLLQLHERFPHRYPYFLESVAKGTPNARYDILFAAPTGVLVLNEFLGSQGNVPLRLQGNDFLENLDNWYRAESTPGNEPHYLPFRGGWFLFLSYELAGQVESTLKLPTWPRWLPLAFAARCPAAIIRDHEDQATYLVAEDGFHHLLFTMAQDVEDMDKADVTPHVSVTEWWEEAPDQYIDGVHKVHDYIVEGDVFQVNLSRLWKAKLSGKTGSADIYRSLRQHNPAPFAGIVRWQDMDIVSSSPERLLRVRNGIAECRPIAGTRPRGRDAGGELSNNLDKALSTELIGHPKERAEHVMLIDLVRNDLGRVSQPGSVSVDELMVLESYAHVHHIVSNVKGQLRPEVTPGEALRAVFPGGTITGCPKVRCMEIIAELEQAPREAYTGSMGYLNRDGDLDTNILIRTLMRYADEVQFRAGAGLVFDSQAEKEVEETRAKARGLEMALRS